MVLVLLLVLLLTGMLVVGRATPPARRVIMVCIALPSLTMMVTAVFMVVMVVVMAPPIALMWAVPVVNTVTELLLLFELTSMVVDRHRREKCIHKRVIREEFAENLIWRAELEDKVPIELTGATATALQSLMTILVVRPTFLCVAQHFIRLTNFLKFCTSLFLIFWVLIRMPLQS